MWGVLLAVLAAVPASAQPWELSGGGGFTPTVALDRQAESVTEVNLRGGFTFGVQVTRLFTPRLGIELAWTLQESALELGTAEGAGDLYAIDIANLQANVIYHFGDPQSRWRPFVFGGAGAAFFSARDTESETKAQFGVGGGVKYFPWPAIGLRAHVRYKPTRLNGDAGGAFCDPFNYCQPWLQQVETAVGAIVRF